MRILISDINKTPEQFQEIHGKGLFLGGSEIATAAGLNKFSTPLQLWMRKTGRDTSTVDNYHTRLGLKMERVVYETFLEENPSFYGAKNNSTFQHDSIDWATCTPDYWVNTSEGLTSDNLSDNFLLEIKTSGIWAKKEWEDGKVPDYALIQLQWQMGICGVEKGYLAALIGGKDFYSKEIAFNKDVFAQLLELGDRFLGFVKSDTPPEATYADDLSYIKPKEKEVELVCIDLIREYEVLSKEMTEANSIAKLKKQTADGIKNRITQFLGDANKGVCGDYLVSRKLTLVEEAKPRKYTKETFTVKNIKEKEE